MAVGNSVRFLVTGCGRSGTTYLQRLLEVGGVQCGHEDVYDVYGQNSSDLKYESSWYAAPRLLDMDRGVRVIHLVRHPVLVASSFYKFGLLAKRPIRHLTRGKMWRSLLRPKFYSRATLKRYNFVMEHRRLLKEYTSCFDVDDEVIRLYLYWYDWNKLVEDSCRQRGLQLMRIRLENVADSFSEIQSFFELPGALRHTPPVNLKLEYAARPMPATEMPWRVADLAARYGYDSLQV